jgi:2-oxoisovalerate dehydrogenase E1 component alpha subunit
MPVHYGSKDLNICTVSSPLCTQLPQASGAGYKYRINGEDKVAVTYFGEGAASEGDFHPALNFAATLRCQTMFVCRNNMYAISTPIDDQYAGDGIAARGIAYGMPTIRVDGNDIFAVYAATRRAREMIIRDKRPALIELISYRVGDHSTSDFSAAYRNDEEMKKWTEHLSKFSNPIGRLEKYMLREGLITGDQNEKLRLTARNTVREALKASSSLPKPSIDVMFDGVYDDLPNHILEQKEELRNHLRKYPDHYGLDTFKDGKSWIA